MDRSRDHLARHFFGVYRGVVINNIDPTGAGRVQTQVPAIASAPSGWAPVIGGQHLDVGATVFVSFESGEPEYPVVLGSASAAPIEPVLPASITLVVDEAGTIEIRHVSGTAVSIRPSGKVVIDSAAGVELVAPQVDVQSALVKVTGVLRTQTLIADSVVSASYTPGAGNIC